LWSFATTGSIVSIWPEQTEKMTVYAGTVRGDVWVSTDGGGSWVQVGKPEGIFGINVIVPVPGQPQKAFMSAFGIGGNIIWRTEDYGRKWEQVKDSRFTREPLGLYIHEKEPVTLYAIGAPGLFETHDEGASWMYHEIGSPIASIQLTTISPVKDGPIYLATGGAIFHRSQTLAEPWKRGYGLTALAVRDMVADLAEADKAYSAVYLPNKWSVFYTEDGGATWQPTTLPPQIQEKFLNDTMALDLAKDDDGESVLYAGTNGCGVIHSIDQGKTWETFGRKDCKVGAGEPKSVIDLAAVPNVAHTIYVAADSTKVYVSKDRAQTWQVTKLDLTNEIQKIAVDPFVADRVYLIAGADGFWRSDDGAKTWRSYSTGLQDRSLNNLFAIPNVAETLYISASNGELWKTTDGGARWVSAREDLPTSGISDLAYDLQNNELILSSTQDGVYRFKSGSLFNLWPWQGETK
jgi:photosystem II stability/assembly factor-like uncharacterized protein